MQEQMHLTTAKSFTGLPHRVVVALEKAKVTPDQLDAMTAEEIADIPRIGSDARASIANWQKKQVKMESSARNPDSLQDLMDSGLLVDAAIRNGLQLANHYSAKHIQAIAYIIQNFKLVPKGAK